MPGPAPKPARTRRRSNVPKSYGLATPTDALAAPHQDRVLGIDGPVHQLVADMWTTAQTSAEALFWTESDWARLRMEMWHANGLLTSGKPISPSSWRQVQHGLSDMLISPAAKRRAAIELQAAAPDPDENAAVSMIGTYKSKLKPVD